MIDMHPASTSGSPEASTFDSLKVKISLDAYDIKPKLTRRSDFTEGGLEVSG